MEFKTNARCEGCKARILAAMNNRYPDGEWSMDIENADKLLRVHGIPENAETAAQVLKTLEETGFKGDWQQHTGY